ncbi:unnamed protein product [Closterium sp. Naga37s-1]|nr:unnamed protein product [Closterium sp. Naga37s-1]
MWPRLQGLSLPRSLLQAAFPLSSPLSSLPVQATSHLVKEVVEPMLDSYKPPGVSSLAFKRFKLGSNAPRIEGVKVQRLVEQQVMVPWTCGCGDRALGPQQFNYPTPCSCRHIPSLLFCCVPCATPQVCVKVQWLVEQQVLVDINLSEGAVAGGAAGVKVQRLVEQQVMVDMNLWVGGGSSIILAIASMGVKMHVQVRAGQVHVQVRAGQVHVQVRAGQVHVQER